MNFSYLFLTIAFLTKLHSIKQVDCLPTNEVSVYLDGESSNLRGMVSLSINGGTPQLLEASYAEWSTSSVICRHLGAGPPILTLSTSYSSDGYLYYYSINHIQCTGWETVLTDCDIDFTRSSILFSPKVMEVKCAPSFATDFEVLFVQPFEDSHQGIVLTYLDGRWGPVIGNTSNSNDVICKEMGHSPGEDLHRGNSGVQVFAHPVIKNLTCRGNERRMEECSYSKLDNQTYHSSSGRDPVYVAACNEHFYDRVKPTSYSFGVDEYHPQGIHSSSFVSVLTFIVLMSVSLVICLRCGLGGEHSDNESSQVDLGNSSEIRHIYQRYHTGTGPGYQQVPCTIYQAPPVPPIQRNPVRPSLQKLSGHGPSDPPSYDTSEHPPGSSSGHRTELGRGYAAHLEHHRGCHSGHGAPANSASWHLATDHDHGVESFDGYQPGSSPQYCVHPVQGTTPHESSATAFQPGSGATYQSIPQSTPEGTMAGSTGAVSGWPPPVGLGSPSGGQHHAAFAPAPLHIGPGNDPAADPDLPSYSEAVFRSSFQL